MVIEALYKHFGLALVLTNIPVVDAARTCSYDRFGRYRCRSRLSSAARIGMGVGIAIAGLVVLGLLFCLILLRRRRARRTNAGGYVETGPIHHDKPPHQPGQYQPHPGGEPNYPNQNGYGSPNYPVNEPQFPTPSYQGGGGYAPPNGPPPTNYAPPAGPPPAK
ncbi:unnamed protein product [Rhizoctonia solani]|uniref:Transmembrane protein n=1 Tax=Rhizoctonia solani TaxID=456999 RepID=A0A8H2X695_9AGAM|nr:unnamed protein product [Rhizoctonia solani]